MLFIGKRGSFHEDRWESSCFFKKIYRTRVFFPRNLFPISQKAASEIQPFRLANPGWRNLASSEVGITVQRMEGFKGIEGLFFHKPLVVTLFTYLGLM